MLSFIKICTAEKKNVKAIYQMICTLEENEFNFESFENIYKRNHNNPDYYYYAAINQREEIIGFISCHTQWLLHHCNKVAEIQELFVEPAYRGQGIGKQLIEHLKIELGKANIFFLEVTAQNKRTQTHAFYKASGFNSSHKKFTLQL